MVFIDLLTAQLFALGFSGLILAYTVLKGISQYRKGKDMGQVMRSGQIPLALLGLYILITGLYGQLTWPLPGSYNILYYDILPFWGIFLLASAWALHSRLKLQFVGLFSLLVGAMSILYGISAYNLGLSSAPIAVLGLYGLFGIAGIFGYPMTLMFDMAQEKMRHKWFGWKIITLIFIIALVLASLLALYIAASAVPIHLKSPP